MCRWFAFISNTGVVLLDDVLVRPVHSIARQVVRRNLPPYEPAIDENGVDQNLQPWQWQNEYANCDGLGVAWYGLARSSGHGQEIVFPTLYKTLATPMNDPNFRSACKTSRTMTMFTHLRAASENLPVHEFNCHPFQFGR